MALNGDSIVIIVAWHGSIGGEISSSGIRQKRHHGGSGGIISVSGWHQRQKMAS